jgi:hypothetical protein
MRNLEVISVALLLLAQVGPFDDLIPKKERLGSGPHILVVSDGNAMTRLNYLTGSKCQKARDEIRRQVSPPKDSRFTIYGPPAVKAFCIPR